VANGGTTPCHTQPWRKYKNVLNVFFISCDVQVLKEFETDSHCLSSFHPCMILTNQDMRLLHCQYSFNLHRIEIGGEPTLLNVCLCIQKEERSTRSSRNYDSILLLKPKNVVTMHNVIKWMVHNKISIKISLLQTSTVVLSVYEHLFQTFVFETVQQLHATCTLKETLLHLLSLKTPNSWVWNVPLSNWLVKEKVMFYQLK
jgi:hypothetical protein